MYFRLNNIEYQVESCSVRFDIIPHNQNLKMFIDIDAKTDNDSIDSELCEIHLYHNNGFEIGGKSLRNLTGKKFEWTKATNRMGEEAGTLYVLEHEEVTSGVIEILGINKETICIKWTGLANIYWNDEFGENVPFETEIETKIPEIPKFKVINGMETTKAKLDKNTELELLNFDEILKECNRCRVMWQNNDRDAWEKYDAILNLKIIYKGVEYNGQAIYKGSATQCNMVLDDNCPVKIKITKTTIDTTFGKFNFYVVCE